MTIFDRRPRLRWTVPAAAGLVIVAGAALGSAQVSADSGLPSATPEELLVALQTPEAQALSGTVTVTSDLGLPDLSIAGQSAGSGPMALASGTHTLRVWMDGETGSRVDLLSRQGEYDVIRNGVDVWTWDSSAQEAQHLTLTKPEGSPTVPTDLPSTPAEAASLVLAGLDPTTEITSSGAGTVAGRDAYELTLTPQQDGTKVQRVVLAIDAETNVPLRFQAFSTQTQAPAFEVAFTSIDFDRPDSSVFAFTPPAGATVTELDGAAMEGNAESAKRGDVAEPTMVGTGWTRVLVADMPATETPDGGASADAGSPADLLAGLPRTSGPWGSGFLLDGTLFSAILTDDGRIAVGAVTPEILGAALATS